MVYGRKLIDRGRARSRKGKNRGESLAGRITVGLITPYPPGIPLLIPGEVFSQKIVDYLLFAREFSKLCPGFETDIHGLVEVEDEHGEVRFYADCVAQSEVEAEAPPAKPTATKAKASAKVGTKVGAKAPARKSVAK